MAAQAQDQPLKELLETYPNGYEQSQQNISECDNDCCRDIDKEKRLAQAKSYAFRICPLCHKHKTEAFRKKLAISTSTTHKCKNIQCVSYISLEFFSFI